MNMTVDGLAVALLTVRVDAERSSLFLCPNGDVLGVVVRHKGVQRLLKFRNAIAKGGGQQVVPGMVDIDCEIEGNVFDIVCSVCHGKRTWHE